MSRSLIRRAIDLAFPKGPPYVPKPDGDMEAYRDGEATILESIRDDVISMSYMRDPARTPRLEDLELEFGRADNQTLSDATRRSLLRPVRYPKKTTGNDDDLQTRLDNAGFDLIVYNNSPDGPAIDPDILMDQSFQLQALSGDYYAGNDAAYAGRIGGEWLVNGPVYEQFRGVFGAGDMYAGNTNSVAGYFEEFYRTTIEYDTPIDAEAWPFCFFVGGVADINPATGEIIGIDQGLVPRSERKQLEDIILKFKGLYTWCGLIVTFT